MRQPAGMMLPAEGGNLFPWNGDVILDVHRRTPAPILPGLSGKSKRAGIRRPTDPPLRFHVDSAVIDRRYRGLPIANHRSAITNELIPATPIRTIGAGDRRRGGVHELKLKRPGIRQPTDPAFLI
jgi:hypothetical protein